MTQTKMNMQVVRDADVTKNSNKPEKKFKAGGVTATVWRNESQEGAPYRSISIERNYTDKNGKWQATNSLHVNDLPRAQMVLQKAYEFIVLAEKQSATASA